MISSSKKWLSLTIAASFFLGALSARANLLQALPEMDDLLRWAAFSLGGGVNAADTDMVGTTDIYGDVGVAGNGNVSMTGNSTIHGDLYYRSNGTLSMKGASKVTGTKWHNRDSELDHDVTASNNTSAHAATFASSTAYSGITSITSSMTLTAKHDRPGNSTVLNLTNFSLGDHQTLTLVGSASDVFILNISNTFLMGAQSQVVLQGGLAWDDVIFNVKGNGSDATFNAQSTFRAVLLATKRNVKMDGGATVLGEVIANQITMKGGSQINRPPLTSP